MRITGNIITLNEEDDIEACIRSLQRVCDEIIVVDSNSTDNTVGIATDLGATIVKQSYLGDGLQKNVASKYATNDWILSIDADERLDDELVASLQALYLDSKEISGYTFKRKNYIGERWIEHCGWYPDWNVRLYRKDMAQFDPVAGHAKVKVDAPGKLEGHIIHYSYKNYDELLYKTNRFSSRGAKMLMEKGRRTNGFSPALHFMSAFFRKYILQRGFLQGVDGLTISLTASINSYMKYAKLIEMRQSKKTSQSLWDQ